MAVQDVKEQIRPVVNTNLYVMHMHWVTGKPWQAAPGESLSPSYSEQRNILAECSTTVFQGRRQGIIGQHGGLGRPLYGAARHSAKMLPKNRIPKQKTLRTNSFEAFLA
jgi:hypothetical protein